MQLSIVLINKDTPKLTKEAIKSAIDTIKEVEFEIIVVDNSSNASNVVFLKDSRVKTICGVENKGFGNACNIGEKKASGDVLLFLNSDTILFENAVDFAYSFFKKQQNVGALGIRQLLEDGSLDKGCKRGFPTPLSSLYYFLGLSKIFPHSKRFGAHQQTFIDEKDVVEVDCISGAFMMIKKEVFEKVGGFDEDYFLYGEDVDLCYRLKKIGYKNIYFGKVSFLHYKNMSGKKSLKVLESFYDSMQIFYDKHYKKKYPFFVNFIVKVGIKLKKSLAKRNYEKVLKKDGGNSTCSI